MPAENFSQDTTENFSRPAGIAGREAAMTQDFKRPLGPRRPA
jgi:hypothetical protein